MRNKSFDKLGNKCSIQFSYYLLRPPILLNAFLLVYHGIVVYFYLDKFYEEFQYVVLMQF